MMNRKKGNMGESMAAEFLTTKHIRIVDRNYQKAVGEIDLIGFDENILVFIEVKMRKTNRYGHGAESVTIWKQQKIIETAMHYIQERGYEGFQCRFDVVEITLGPPQQIIHYKNAFE